MGTYTYPQLDEMACDLTKAADARLEKVVADLVGTVRAVTRQKRDGYLIEYYSPRTEAARLMQAMQVYSEDLIRRDTTIADLKEYTHALPF